MPKTVEVPRDLLIRLGQVLDGVCTFNECNCEGDECNGNCVNALASECQDAVVDLLSKED
jgi:hypothetical protein